MRAAGRGGGVGEGQRTIQRRILLLCCALSTLESWLPHLPIRPFPNHETLPSPSRDPIDFYFFIKAVVYSISNSVTWQIIVRSVHGTRSFIPLSSLRIPFPVEFLLFELTERQRKRPRERKRERIKSRQINRKNKVFGVTSNNTVSLRILREDFI